MDIYAVGRRCAWITTIAITNIIRPTRKNIEKYNKKIVYITLKSNVITPINLLIRKTRWNLWLDAGYVDKKDVVNVARAPLSTRSNRNNQYADK